MANWNSVNSSRVAPPTGEANPVALPEDCRSLGHGQFVGWLRRALCITGLACAVGGASAKNTRGDRVASLIRTLQSAGDYKQRLVAAIGLARLEDPRVVPALIAAIHDNNRVVQGVAADVLGELADHRGRAPLEALIRRTEHGFVRSRAQQALARIPKASPIRAPAPKHRDPRRMAVRGLMGTLHQDAIQAGIKGRFDAVMGCINRRVADLPALGGAIRIRMRISTTGKTKWLRILSSDLGNLPAERCILDVLETASFAAPGGGDAEFSIPLEFNGAAAPERLSATNSAVGTSLRTACNALLVNGAPSAPPLRPPGGLVVTLYLNDTGSVVSAGLAAEGKPIPARFGEQFVTNAKKLKLKWRASRGRHAKISYRFDCPGT